MKRHYLIHALPVLALAGCLFTQLVSAQLPNAWQIDDHTNTTGSFLSYTNLLNAGLRTAATNAGFDFSVNARFVTDRSTGSSTMAMIYGDGKTRWEILWSLTNGDLVSELITNVNPVAGETFVVTANGTGASLYHTHEIVFNPTNRLASYRVDGQVVTTNWTGSTASGLPAGQVLWGAVSSEGASQMNFHQVSFAVTNAVIAGYDAGTAPDTALDPTNAMFGWKLSPPNPFPGSVSNISPDTVPLPVNSTATTLAAANVEPYQATLSGVVNPGGLAAFAWFEWGTDTNYGNAISPHFLLADTNDFNLAQTLTGLAKGATYHFRCVATNLLGVVYGQDAVFTTPSEFSVTTLADSGYGSLRQSIAHAQSGDTITFATNGVIKLTIGDALTHSEFEITNNLAITGPGPASLAIQDSHSYRVFDIASNATVHISGLSIQNTPIAGEYGAGIFNGGALTVTNCTISGNFANDSGGGGIYNGGILTVINTTFSGNDAGAGGGIYNGGGTVTVSNSTFSGNSGENGYGGAIYNGYGILTVVNTTFSGNSTYANGGGIYNDSGTVAVVNSTVIGNSSSDESGGGICNYGGAVTVSNSTFSSNSGYSGGGIYNTTNNGDVYSGTLTLNNSTFFGNSATNGGGIFNAATVTIDNSTFFGNSAMTNGGGLENANSLTINNSTFLGNSAGGYGGGVILDSGSFGNFVNTIIAGNTAGHSAPSPDVAGNYYGIGNLVGGNPLLAPLGNYGGPTQTMPPLAGSPALDAGVDTIIGSLPNDQRGYPRLSGAHVDVGAVEAQYAPANNPPLLMNSIWSSTGGSNSFQFTFTNVSDADFTVLASTNLALPLSDWIPIGNAEQNPAGQFQFTDQGATNYPRRFYRLVSP
jgi:Vibrio cholerae sialidase, lectin insertion/Chlamydia polymorphic membrane protein (Chlamydia_PMP) repeat